MSELVTTNNFEIFSQLPLDIVIQIVTKYTKKFRVEKFNGKTNFIISIDEERITGFEKLYKTIHMPRTIIFPNLVYYNTTEVYVKITSTKYGCFCFVKYHTGCHNPENRYYCFRQNNPYYDYL